MELGRGNKGKNRASTKEESRLICCKLYISESRNTAAMELIEQAARVDKEAVIVYKFSDRAYNRVRFTLVSYIIHDPRAGLTYSPLRQMMFAMAEAAYGVINLETHNGAHPRLGVIDHISLHPLAQASVEEAAALAKLVASDFGTHFQVPVFLYEAAHPNGKPLDAIRRDLGYYRPNVMGNQWAGWTLSDVLSVEPDEGPAQVNPGKGISMIGASSWIETYNIPLLSTDLSVVRRIAGRVRERGGGLPTVQAIALVHGDDTIEIACNLLNPMRVGADRVQSRVEMLAAEEAIDFEKGYYTDLSQEMLIDRYYRLVSSDE